MERDKKEGGGRQLPSWGVRRKYYYREIVVALRCVCWKQVGLVISTGIWAGPACFPSYAHCGHSRQLPIAPHFVLDEDSYFKPRPDGTGSLGLRAGSF